jgi:hypothetical protein
MKNFYTLLILLVSLPGFTQVADRTETDCNNTSQSIYGVLGTGKALIVASEGLDCSICQGKAPGLQNWAAANSAKVQVWGAMTFTYNNNTPTCAQVSNWVNTYNWTSVFTFVDNNEFYFQSGTPIYWVYSPADSTRSGPYGNENVAYQAALDAALPDVSAPQYALKDVNHYTNENTLFLGNLPQQPLQLKLLGLSGQIIKSVTLEENNAQIAIANLPAGIYLVNLNLKGAQTTFKIQKF